ncbi:dihydrofolate reductase [Clostridium sp. BNL1100]|uniref:dihydrofolate reductase n=1 Tax=Clostridium sp. BNL1100 TaxID=755731 RepID=UPI00024A7906|nr:dihydrofolate reductase [Clostridium sp. BNL1100]AEY65246.1 dihydrofolate reductase [Clostridium sp. BNL1100]
MISMIWAMGQNNALGCKNRMPWYIPADFSYFKKITMGKTVIMGRKTFESLGKPLPGRKNIVITRETGYSPEGCTTVNSIQKAMDYTGEEEVFIIGGAEIYKEFLPIADRLYLTLIEKEFEADTFFPEIDYSQWKQVSCENGIKDEKNPYKYKWLIYERIKQ